MAMHRAIIPLDYDDVGPVLPVPIAFAVPMAFAVVIECLRAVLAVMEALAVLIDDNRGPVVMAVIIPVLIGGNDHVGRGRRSQGGRGQEKRHCAQNQGVLHFQISEETKVPFDK